MCASVCVFARAYECVRVCACMFGDVAVPESVLVRVRASVCVFLCLRVRVFFVCECVYSYVNACVRVISVRACILLSMLVFACMCVYVQVWVRLYACSWWCACM